MEILNKAASEALYEKVALNKDFIDRWQDSELVGSGWCADLWEELSRRSEQLAQMAGAGSVPCKL